MAEPPKPTRAPLLRAIELDVGQSQEMTLADGTKATVKLLDLKETRDPFRDAVRAATDHGVTAIVQPGGSVNDYDAVAACNESKTAMVFSLERCFSHH